MNKDLMIIGVDIGLSGSLCFFDGNTYKLIDMPIQKKKSGKSELNIKLICDLLKEHKGTLIIENLHAFPGQGSVSSSNLTRQRGIFEGLAYGLDLNLIIINPQAWKKYFGLSGIANKTEAKDMSRAKAANLVPALADSIKRKKDHNRAESILINIYGQTQINFN